MKTGQIQRATAESVAKLFNVPLANVRKQYASNASQLRAMESKAIRTGRKVNGFTAEQLSGFASHAETQAKG